MLNSRCSDCVCAAVVNPNILPEIIAERTEALRSQSIGIAAFARELYN